MLEFVTEFVEPWCTYPLRLRISAINFMDKLRPVPSYPEMVDDKKTKYEPIICFTSDSGSAAASSMMAS